MYEYKQIFKSINMALDEYQRTMTSFLKTSKGTKKPKDYSKIKDFLFKKVF